ncbi:MAG TPA: DJ-1/PfpI family protein [Thermoanaerobaculia bacterium]|nr:DJ-1/PfpI family protein [Thermoanaerobaculia bacterium]
MKRPIPFIAMFVLLAPLLLAGAGCRPADPEGTEATEETPAALAAPAPAAPAPQPAPPAGDPGSFGDPAAAPGESAAGGELPPPPTLAPNPPLPTDRPLRAGFLVVDGVYNTELMAPYDVFQHTTYHTQPGIEVFTISPNGQPVTTAEGLRILPHYSFANAPALDILVVPSTRGSMDRDLQNQELIDWVRQVGGQARHVLGLCDGTFVVAQAGLLDGQPATTFPEDYQRFAQRFPRVSLRVNVSFVDAGKVITSQGGARSYEAAMHLVDRLYSRQVAQKIGQGLLVPWPPDPDTMSPRVVEPAAVPAPAPAN